MTEVAICSKTGYCDILPVSPFRSLNLHGPISNHHNFLKAKLPEEKNEKKSSALLFFLLLQLLVLSICCFSLGVEETE